MTQPKPYFMKNPKWYKFDDKKWKYVLTAEASPKAHRSYKKFYEESEIMWRE